MFLRVLYRYRSAKTGRWVPAWYAKRHPNTTVRERANRPA